MNSPPYHTNLPAKHPNRSALGLLQNFFAGAALEVKTRGYCAAAVALVKGLFDNAAEPVNVPLLQAEAEPHDMTATLDRRRRVVVFRRLWRGDEFPEGETADTWLRASGEVFCEVCGYQFRDHPADLSEPSLQVLCSGRRVKL